MIAKPGNLAAIKLEKIHAFRAADQLGDFISPGFVALAPVYKGQP